MREKNGALTAQATQPSIHPPTPAQQVHGIAARKPCRLLSRSATLLHVGLAIYFASLQPSKASLPTPPTFSRFPSVLLGPPCPTFSSLPRCSFHSTRALAGQLASPSQDFQAAGSSWVSKLLIGTFGSTGPIGPTF